MLRKLIPAIMPANEMSSVMSLASRSLDYVLHTSMLLNQTVVKHAGSHARLRIFNNGDGLTQRSHLEKHSLACAIIISYLSLPMPPVVLHAASYTAARG